MYLNTSVHGSDNELKLFRIHEMPGKHAVCITTENVKKNTFRGRTNEISVLEENKDNTIIGTYLKQ